ncbi:protein of unknown function [Candidatus Hydrogenisulfobacillus filiaventi]|uniref:Uncharacterized protein n=1 Tax=Candidatus Hydrogenisulfobacillus filiaventi TaxID=2707344 RepID=A0A6F8ZDG2_9FIRM|nr:protein of unknown function [Candidatus Hydrogenisulfobacillus filiaventi]
MDEPGPDATPFRVFPKRLLRHDRARAALDAVLQATRDQGSLAPRWTRPALMPPPRRSLPGRAGCRRPFGGCCWPGGNRTPSRSSQSSTTRVGHHRGAPLHAGGGWDPAPRGPDRL